MDHTDSKVGRSEDKAQHLDSPLECIDEDIVVWNHKKEFALLLVGLSPSMNLPLSG